MERNNENRNQYNDRTRNEWDQDNNRNQSSDFRQNRSQYADRNENQWDSNRRQDDRTQQDNFERNRYGNNRNERLESMGSLGNDTDRFNDDDYSNRGSYSQRGSGNYGGSYESGNYGREQTRNFDYGNRRDVYDDRRNRRGDSPNNSGNDSRNWWDKTKDEVSGWFGD